MIKAREKRLQVRLSEEELAALQAEAERQGVSASELVRDWIKALRRTGQPPQFPA